MSVPWPSTPSRTGGTVACLAEALLWVGASVAVSPPWQLGPLGKGAGLALLGGSPAEEPQGPGGWGLLLGVQKAPLLQSKPMTSCPSGLPLGVMGLPLHPRPTCLTPGRQAGSGEGGGSGIGGRAVVGMLAGHSGGYKTFAEGSLALCRGGGGTFSPGGLGLACW